jgi:hypothetical protein
VTKKTGQRYTITLEYCGEEKPWWIVRFCGDWLDKCEAIPQALAVIKAHRRTRTVKRHTDKKARKP